MSKSIKNYHVTQEISYQRKNFQLKGDNTKTKHQHTKKAFQIKLDLRVNRNWKNMQETFCLKFDLRLMTIGKLSNFEQIEQF